MPMQGCRQIAAVLEAAPHLLHPTPADTEQFGSLRLRAVPVLPGFDELASQIEGVLHPTRLLLRSAYTNLQRALNYGHENGWGM